MLTKVIVGLVALAGLTTGGVYYTSAGKSCCEPGSCAVPCYACPSEVDKLAIADLFEAVYGDPW